MLVKDSRLLLEPECVKSLSIMVPEGVPSVFHSWRKLEKKSVFPMGVRLAVVLASVRPRGWVPVAVPSVVQISRETGNTPRFPRGTTAPGLEPPLAVKTGLMGAVPAGGG